MISRKIDAHSQDAVTTGLDIFHTPITNVSLSKSQYKEFLTLNPVIDPPYHLKIPATSGFPDFKHMYLRTEWVFQKKAQGDAVAVNIVNGDEISIVNGFGGNWIKNIKVSIGGREIYNSNNLYAYKNYIDTELSYSKEAKDTHLMVMGYAQDAVDQNSVTGAGFLKRKALINNGQSVEFITRLNVDVFNIDKYFLNNTDIDIDIYPNDARFLMIGPNILDTTNLYCTLRKVRLHVMFHDLTDGLAISVAQKIARPLESAKYAIRASELKTAYIEADRMFFDVNIDNGQIPRKVIIGMLSRTDYDGNIRTSPFNFKHFNLRSLRIDWNGLTNPNIAYELDYANNRYTRAYFDMMQSTGFAWSPASNGIDMERFKSGWNFYVFNLTTNLEDEKAFELIRQGTTSLRAEFMQVVPAGGITMIIYTEKDNLMKIDNNRTVTTDLTV